MSSELVQDKVFNVLVEALSIEELEAILTKKKQKTSPVSKPGIKPNPMTERQKLKEHLRNEMIRRKMFYPIR